MYEFNQIWINNFYSNVTQDEGRTTNAEGGPLLTSAQVPTQQNLYGIQEHVHSPLLICG